MFSGDFFGMNIKERIGQRIREQRNAKGLTRKALAELTTELKPSSINNWERGDRTPGPEEIKLLAKILEASPAFLMCLTDENQPYHTERNPRSHVPLLDHKQTCDYQEHIHRISNLHATNKPILVPVSQELMSQLGEHAFALKMIDDSMMPDIRVNDVLIVDPSVSPNPGDFVCIKIIGKQGVFVCQYRQLSYESSDFELITLNENWPNITLNAKSKAEIIGKIIQNMRIYC